MVSDDFQDHLAAEHRGSRGGLFEAEMPGMHRAQRRLATSARRGGRSRHFTPSAPTTTSNTPSAAMLREPMDPIAGECEGCNCSVLAPAKLCNASVFIRLYMEIRAML